MTFFFQLLDGKNFQSKSVKALFYGKTWFRWNIFLEGKKIKPKYFYEYIK